MRGNAPDFLDPDRPDTRRLDVAEATALAETTLMRIGFPRDEARIVTDQLIDNSLCGYRFAGLPRILAIARDARTGAVRTPVRMLRETPVSALVDGGNNVGYVAVYRGMEIAIAKAKAAGVASVGVCNSYYSGRNAYYLERIVDRGLIGLHTASGAPHVVPPGGRRPALGTNPIAFGFPSKEGPVIYDIGTASLMWASIPSWSWPGKDTWPSPRCVRPEASCRVPPASAISSSSSPQNASSGHSRPVTRKSAGSSESSR